MCNYCNVPTQTWDIHMHMHICFRFITADKHWVLFSADFPVPKGSLINRFSSGVQYNGDGGGIFPVLYVRTNSRFECTEGDFMIAQRRVYNLFETGCVDMFAVSYSFRSNCRETKQVFRTSNLLVAEVSRKLWDNSVLLVCKYEAEDTRSFLKPTKDRRKSIMYIGVG